MGDACGACAEFKYPSRWLADQQLYRRYAERIEQRTGLDPPSAARSVSAFRHEATRRRLAQQDRIPAWGCTCLQMLHMSTLATPVEAHQLQRSVLRKACINLLHEMHPFHKGLPHLRECVQAETAPGV